MHPTENYLQCIYQWIPSTEFVHDISIDHSYNAPIPCVRYLFGLKKIIPYSIFNHSESI